MKTIFEKEIVRPFTVLNKSAEAEENYGFITRTDFINLTGVFVSPFRFWCIANDYNEQHYLSPEKFAQKWKEDNEANCETIKLDGEITCLFDDDEITAFGSDHYILCDRTAIDIINDLLVDGWEQRQKRDELYAVIDKIYNLINNSKKKNENGGQIIMNREQVIDKIMNEYSGFEVERSTVEMIYDLAGAYEVTPEAIYPGLRIIMNNNFGISDSSPNNEVIDAFMKQAMLDTQWNGK